MSDDNYDYVEVFALSLVRRLSVNEELVRTMGKLLKAASFTCDDLGNTFKTRVRLAELVRLICDEMTMTFDNTFVAGFQTSRTLLS